MTAQQLRGTQVLIGQPRLPSPVRWAASPEGAGILTFGPSLLLDAASSIGTDLPTGRRRFDTEQFLVAPARSQSGNLVGFAGGRARRSDRRSRLRSFGGRRPCRHHRLGGRARLAGAVERIRWR
jgi:hypothetical protein